MIPIVFPPITQPIFFITPSIITISMISEIIFDLFPITSIIIVRNILS
jgi:hypothetical protein